MEMQQAAIEFLVQGKTTGFVPTMGSLHQGHLSLVHRSRDENDITIVSIFVNPAQFAPNEDFTKYPRNTEADSKLLEEAGVDILFIPEVEDIYPEGYQTYIEVLNLTKKQEGEFRPDHFKGVTTIVGMLFNIVHPDNAYFGQKDAQQSAVIMQMVRDLKYKTRVVICPIVREKDGLAMSSRNVYLSPEEREKALILSRSLRQAEELITSGERDAAIIIKNINRNFLSEKSVQLNYIRIVEAGSFSECLELNSGKSYYILIACKIGKTRLIDNTFVKL